MKIEVIGGDFLPHPKAKFVRSGMQLYVGEGGKLRAVNYRLEEIVAVQIRDSWWIRWWDKSSDWTKAVLASGLAGLPGAGANFMLPEFVWGQKAIVTWANSVIGGVAAAAAIKNSRRVRFYAQFSDGAKLKAKAEQRELNERLMRMLAARV
ncbi:hypothetical protein [Hirschia baltica]|uniref:Uncharacterized protein n=1 Tax=Hirschia baltica (strain ATCC 49814 / DSM 5838 / IFAM 1418) TaxID=582402 RepID=C6XMJ3_HIRBI|nr:hypothetical protein [Hirschia baltica]ACT59907.1 hypothetical protein Hbal_2227 [Hirschia baltica ATCC 49814]